MRPSAYLFCFVLVAGCSSTREDAPPDGGGHGAGVGGVGPGGGAGGSSLGGAGGGATCTVDATHASVDHQLTFTAQGLASTPLYDGTAVVERSTADGLVLAYALPASPTDGPPQHVTIGGLDPMPILPLGARVWLTKQDVPKLYNPFFEVPSWAISIRDRQDGQILFGGFKIDLRDAAAPLPTGAPVAIGVVTPGCSEATVNSCEGATITYLDVDVLGDSPQRIGHGETRSVTVGGVTYDVAIRAWEVTGQPTASFCSDTGYSDSIGATVVAHDLAAAISGVDVGEPIACTDGNGLPYRYVSFSLYNTALDTYDGPAIYRGLDPSTPNSYLLDLPGLPQDPTARVSIQNVGDTLAGTTAGTSFWVSIPAISPMLLRESQQGPLVLAFAQLPDPASPNAPSALAQIMGVTLTAEQRCLYANRLDGTPVGLFDLVVGTDPSTRIRSGELGRVVVGDRAYDLEVYGQGEVNLFVSRAP
jgi:hypothetical protein